MNAEFALWLAVALAALIATWFVLLYTGVLPASWKRGTWIVVGTAGVGIAYLIVEAVKAQREQIPEPGPEVVTRQGPSPEEVKLVDERTDELEAEAEEVLNHVSEQ